MPLKSLHLLVGVAGVLVFLGTGGYMATHFPAAYEHNEAIRYMYRANHVYLLLAGLINIAIGIYRGNSRPGWRGGVALAGSALVLAAPLLLVYAFFAEPPRGVPERPATLIGMVMLLLGVFGQWPNHAPRGEKKD
jgi:hypothetical protein